MKFICALLKWGLRISVVTLFFIKSEVVDGNMAADGLCVLLGDLLFSLLSLMRFTPDEIFKVITGFGPGGDYGHYEYTDNSAKRCIGFICWLFAVMCRFGNILSLFYLICS